mmetsp:Transcript_39775/g.69872  ORF Transcript_39775/g.69872 Transcript_39775/m.69872 type:complete len:230 (+) Transcript_39775:27-716(+)
MAPHELKRKNSPDVAAGSASPDDTGLSPELNQQGIKLVQYECTTCRQKSAATRHDMSDESLDLDTYEANWYPNVRPSSADTGGWRLWMRTRSLAPVDENQELWLKTPTDTPRDVETSSPPHSETKYTSLFSSSKSLFTLVLVFLCLVSLALLCKAVLNINYAAEEKRRIAAEEAEQRAALMRWRFEEEAAEAMWAAVQQETIANCLLSSAAGALAMLTWRELWPTVFGD